ncbi:MAG: phosphopantetheine-binding protein, partial [Nostoc sp.]
MWRNLLGVEQIGIHNNFFELGGHSLLAAHLLFQISEAFHCDLSLRNILERPTIEELAVHIDNVQEVSPDIPISTPI